MARQTFYFGRFFDIRVGAHVSWLAVYAFMTIALARAVGTVPRVEAYALAASCALVLFAGVVAHELAHALVARRFHVRTSAITLFLFGGIATLEDEPRSAKADALIALAGPAMSAAIAALAFGLLFALDRVLPGGSQRDALGLLGTYVVLANAVLAAFNLVPAYPMDGGRVLRAFLWRRSDDRVRATNVAARVGIVFALVLVAGGVLLVAGSRDPVYGWYVLLGAFLLRQGTVQERDSRPARRSDAEAGAPA